MKSIKAIEVEKKVNLEACHLKQIEERGKFLQSVRIQDCYFDTPDYRFTTQNMWLRKRENVFELKVGIKQENGKADKYEEISDEKRILSHLRFDMGDDLPTALSQNGLFPFCSFITTRRSYQLEEMKIDIDEADFGDLTYKVAEIELVVSDLEDVHEAEQKIFAFIEEMGIDPSVSVPAKLTYYLYHKRPDHYRALLKHAVIKPMI